MTDSLALAYYDQHKSITIQVDASRTWMGTVLMQEREPI